MIEGIESLYAQIGESLVECVDEPWKVAEVEMMYYDDGDRSFGLYRRSVDEVDRPLTVSSELREALVRMRELLVSEGKRPFGAAKFRLIADGDFKLSYDYDNCDENGFKIFNAEEDWKRSKARVEHFREGIKKMKRE